MEENNKTAPVQNAQGNQHQDGENKNRRRRGHRGGKKYQEKKQRAAAAAAAAENAQKSEGAPQKTEKNADTVQKNNPGKDKKHDNRNHHHNHQKGDKKPNERPHQKDSAPQKEDRELAEWRAKIVLNSAPAAPSAPIV